MKFNQTKMLAMPLVAAVLMACGGGGGGSRPLVDDTIAVEGVVAKGPAAGAKVRILTSTTPQSVLASAVTDAQGRYTIKLAKQSQPILVEADLEGADIKNEVTGGTYKGRANEVIRAVVTSADTSKTINVTPFSDMAATMTDKGQLTAEGIDRANRVVRQLLNNTDHLTAPVTGGEMEIKLTAVQQLVQNNSAGLGAVLTQMRDATTVPADGSVFIQASIATSLLNACGNTCTSSSFVAPTEPIPAPGGGSSTTTTPTPTQTVTTPTPTQTVTTPSPVDTAFSFFQDLRDTLVLYNNSTKTGELDLAGDRLANSITIAAQPIDDELIELVGLFGTAESHLKKFKAGIDTRQTIFNQPSSVFGRTSSIDPNGVNISAGLLPKQQCTIASGSLVTDATGKHSVGADYTTTGVVSANASLFVCFGVGTYGRLYPGLDGSMSRWQSIFVAPQPDGSFKYVHRMRQLPFNLVGNPASTIVKEVSGNITVVRNAANDVTSFNLSGKLVPGLKGHTLSQYALLDRVDAALSFTVSEPSTNSGMLALSGSMNLIRNSGELASSVDIASGSMVSVKTDLVQTDSYTNTFFGGTSCPAGTAVIVGSTTPNLFCTSTVSSTRTTSGLSTMTLDVAVAAPGVKFQGVVTTGSPGFNAVGKDYLPTKFSLQGKIFEAEGTGFRLLLDGKATVEALNYASYNPAGVASLPIRAEFIGKVLLKSRPEMSLVLTAEQVAAGTNSASGSFGWNGKLLRLAVSSTGTLTVSNDAGMSFVIPKGGSNAPQDVMLGTTKVGTINLDQQRIEYTDGRFQQF